MPLDQEIIDALGKRGLEVFVQGVVNTRDETGVIYEIRRGAECRHVVVTQTFDNARICRNLANVWEG